MCPGKREKPTLLLPYQAPPVVIGLSLAGISIRRTTTLTLAVITLVLLGAAELLVVEADRTYSMMAEISTA